MSNFRFEVESSIGEGLISPAISILSKDNDENGFSPVKKRKPRGKSAKCQESNRPKKIKASKVKKGRSFVSKHVIIESHRITLTLPIYTASEANSFEKWQIKHARHKTQQAQVRFALMPFQGKIPLPCEITLHRIAPRELDLFENLPYSQKWLADACADFLIPGLKPGRADADPRIKFRASQEKSRDYGVKIIFDF